MPSRRTWLTVGGQYILSGRPASFVQTVGVIVFSDEPWSDSEWEAMEYVEVGSLQ
jgi:hypothetical protein